MKVYLECTYCGKKWDEVIYNEYSLIDKRCSSCNDKNLKTKTVKSGYVDYYQGSPPFEKKELEIESGWPYDQMVGSID